MTEWSAAFLSASGVWLMARRNLFGWPVAFLASLLYSSVFYHAQLYADMTLQGFFCASILYGWILWWRETHLKASTTDFTPRLPIRPLTCTKALSAIGLTIIAGSLWIMALHRWTHDPAPYMDAGLSSASLLAQYWTARRHRENWLLWIGIDLLYTKLFLSRNLYPTSLLYTGFTGLALYGYWAWRPQYPASSNLNRSD